MAAAFSVLRKQRGAEAKPRRAAKMAAKLREKIKETESVSVHKTRLKGERERELESVAREIEGEGVK